jgi:hypothetical protein
MVLHRPVELAPLSGMWLFARGRNWPLTEMTVPRALSGLGRVGDRFRICCYSGIIAKVSTRSHLRLGDIKYTEVSDESWLENRNQPSDRRENSNVFVTDGEARRLRRNE